jgi:IS4 transposase
VHFVTRARANIDATTVEEHPVKSEGVFFDRRITLNGKRPRQLAVRPWRLIGFVCPQSGRPYTFLTNIHHLAASTIALIYQQRRQIELFFKLLKQNLKIRGFIGNSRNAVLTQIWSALCMVLLLAYLKFLSRAEGSLQSILRLLQLNLFVRRDLGALLRAPSPDPPAPARQMALSP